MKDRSKTVGGYGQLRYSLPLEILHFIPQYCDSHTRESLRQIDIFNTQIRREEGILVLYQDANDNSEIDRFKSPYEWYNQFLIEHRITKPDVIESNVDILRVPFKECTNCADMLAISDFVSVNMREVKEFIFRLIKLHDKFRDYMRLSIQVINPSGATMYDFNVFKYFPDDIINCPIDVQMIRPALLEGFSHNYRRMVSDYLIDEANFNIGYMKKYTKSEQIFLRFDVCESTRLNIEKFASKNKLFTYNDLSLITVRGIDRLKNTVQIDHYESENGKLLRNLEKSILIKHPDRSSIKILSQIETLEMICYFSQENTNSASFKTLESEYDSEKWLTLATMRSSTPGEQEELFTMELSRLLTDHRKEHKSPKSIYIHNQITFSLKELFNDMLKSGNLTAITRIVQPKEIKSQTSVNHFQLGRALSSSSDNQNKSGSSNSYAQEFLYLY